LGSIIFGFSLHAVTAGKGSHRNRQPPDVTRPIRQARLPFLTSAQQVIFAIAEFNRSPNSSRAEEPSRRPCRGSIGEASIPGAKAVRAYGYDVNGFDLLSSLDDKDAKPPLLEKAREGRPHEGRDSWIAVEDALISQPGSVEANQ
jgi:hypothetical protein